MIRSLAHRFWQDAEQTGPHPRDIGESVGYALPVWITRVPGITVSSASNALARWNICPNWTEQDRKMRGCLVVQRGRGIILVDAQDPPDEQRFTIAHEAAHFIIEYQRPRRDARQAVGGRAVEVLDRTGVSTPGDRVNAAIADVSLTVRTHLMRRTESGEFGCGVIEAECKADDLAIEMLAPEVDVKRLAMPWAERPFERLVTDVTNLLVNRFVIPERIAPSYARKLAWNWTGGKGVREWLGLE